MEPGGEAAAGLAADLQRGGAILEGNGHLCSVECAVKRKKQKAANTPENGNVFALGRPPPSEIIPGTCPNVQPSTAVNRRGD